MRMRFNASHSVLCFYAIYAAISLFVNPTHGMVFRYTYLCSIMVDRRDKSYIFVRDEHMQLHLIK